MRLAVRMSGAFVCASFALQSIWILVDPKVGSFWLFCHWIGESLLCIFAGIAGFYLEYKGTADHIVTHAAKLAANRIILFVFYFWLGCYVMGIGRVGLWHEVLAHGLGIFAWIVAVCGLFVNCIRQRRSAGAEDAKDVVAQDMALPSHRVETAHASNLGCPNPFDNEKHQDDLEGGTRQVAAVAPSNNEPVWNSYANPFRA